MDKNGRQTIVVNYLGRRGSGPEYAYEMARGLTHCDADVYAIVSAQANNIDAWRKLPLKELIEVDTSDHYSGLASSLWRFFRKEMPRIERRFQGMKVDIFYIPMTHPMSLPLARMFRRMGAKTVMTIHDVWPHKGEVNLHYLPIRWATKLLGREAQKIVLLSRSFVDYTARHYRCRPDDIIVLPHGMFYDDASLSSPPPAPIARFNFLFFGRIVEYKGLEILAEAYRCLSSERPDVSLRIVGSGNFGPYAKAFDGSRRLVVENRFVDAAEVVDFFRMPGTIALLPYTEASQSGVIPIAMKEGAQLIVTRLDGLLEQTAEGTLAVTCHPDADSLYQAMLHTIESYDALAPMRDAATTHIRSISWDALARRLLRESNNNE